MSDAQCYREEKEKKKMNEICSFANMFGTSETNVIFKLSLDVFFLFLPALNTFSVGNK